MNLIMKLVNNLVNNQVVFLLPLMLSGLVYLALAYIFKLIQVFTGSVK